MAIFQNSTILPHSVFYTYFSKPDVAHVLISTFLVTIVGYVVPPRLVNE